MPVLLHNYFAVLSCTQNITQWKMHLAGTEGGPEKSGISHLTTGLILTPHNYIHKCIPTPSPTPSPKVYLNLMKQELVHGESIMFHIMTVITWSLDSHFIFINYYMKVIVIEIVPGKVSLSYQAAHDRRSLSLLRGRNHAMENYLPLIPQACINLYAPLLHSAMAMNHNFSYQLWHFWRASIITTASMWMWCRMSNAWGNVKVSRTYSLLLCFLHLTELVI